MIHPLHHSYQVAPPPAPPPPAVQPESPALADADWVQVACASGSETAIGGGVGLALGLTLGAFASGPLLVGALVGSFIGGLVGMAVSIERQEAAHADPGKNPAYSAQLQRSYERTREFTEN